MQMIDSKPLGFSFRKPEAVPQLHTVSGPDIHYDNVWRPDMTHRLIMSGLNWSSSAPHMLLEVIFQKSPIKSKQQIWKPE